MAPPDLISLDRRIQMPHPRHCAGTGAEADSAEQPPESRRQEATHGRRRGKAILQIRTEELEKGVRTKRPHEKSA